MNFTIDKCPKCGKTRKLMFSNNPLSGSTICFNCIEENLDPNNLNHVDFFCRTYNLPFVPELWTQLIEEKTNSPFEKYTELILNDPNYQPNLSYTSTTKDLWSKVNKEWEKKRSFVEVLNALTPIRESYIERGRLKWGEQYTFEDLIKLDSIYTKTLKANRITNPLQKEAVKTLCKLQIEMDEAIRMKDAKAMKDFSTAYSTFAKQADLETMINETKTEDITTVAELYDYMEKNNFHFKFYDGFPRDEVDNAIKDIQAANRKLILENTGLEQQLSDMIEQKRRSQEEQYAHTVALNSQSQLQELLNFTPDDNEVAVEDDTEAISQDFSTEADESKSKTIKVVSMEDQS